MKDGDLAERRKRVPQILQGPPVGRKDEHLVSSKNTLHGAGGP